MKRFIFLLLSLSIVSSAQAYRKIWYAFVPNNIPDFQIDAVNSVEIDTDDSSAKNNINCSWVNGGLQCVPAVYQVNNHKTIKVNLHVYFNGLPYVATNLNFDYWPYPNNNDNCTYIVTVSKDPQGNYFLGQGSLNCTS